MGQIARVVGCVLLAGTLIGCDGGHARAADDRQAGATLTLTSPAFSEGGTIPREHTCDGADRSPPLRFSGVPERASSLVLVVRGGDAAEGARVLWLLYGLPAASEDLPPGLPAGPSLPDGVRQGRNSRGRVGWTGPCPAAGPVRDYQFHLYALDAELDLRPGATESELERAMQAHVLTETTLTAQYSRAAQSDSR